MAFDATSLAQLIRTKQISPQELINTTYDEINQLNSQLNAVIHRRDEKVRKDAEHISNGPFAGVPTLLKILGQSLKGEPSTASSKLLKDSIATQTDNFVQTLQDSGLLILGQTNAPEFGFKNITDPKLYGPTHNPWNPDYSAGGSSGGAASAVASDMVSIAAASDGGGSIRIPASFSGLIGLKPTRGRVPVGPTGWRGWQGASINFALTRSIRDTATLLDQLQTVQPAAPFQTPLITPGFPNQLTQPVSRTLKVAYSMESPVGTPVSDDAKLAVKQAVEFLESQGIAVEESAPKTDGIALMKAYYIMNGGETAAMFDGINQALGRETTMDDMELTTWTIYQAGKLISAVDYSHSLDLWDQSSYIADQFYDHYDLLLTPTTAFTAPKIDQELMSDTTLEKMRHVTDFDKQERLDLVWEFFEQSLALSPFTQQANLTGQPALSLPTYVSENGLPLGIQFTARKGNEAQLLQIGKLFEDEQKLQFLHPTEQI
ncbi:amidase [Companilactobacillus ginsenosidimutans]|uniref:Amidase n=1 Tax=Companilactobacillus ginsenosidimutans TaxID=1007676 RepID=A0A0H4QFR6_9LACO|nr:amidase [Companilactobacillus ginsenosidimutans]AKP67259.1 amidase [Companilactobacillus ginsenosidimutans]